VERVTEGDDTYWEDAWLHAHVLGQEGALPDISIMYTVKVNLHMLSRSQKWSSVGRTREDRLREIASAIVSNS